MIRDWKLFLLLFLLGLKLAQVTSNFKEKALENLKFEEDRFAKANFIIKQESLINEVYQKTKDINKTNCSYLFHSDENVSKIIAKFQTYISSSAKASGVKIREINWGSTQNGINMLELPFSLLAEGREKDINKFLCYIAKFNKIIHVESLYYRAYSNYISVNIVGSLLKVKGNVCKNSK